MWYPALLLSAVCAEVAPEVLFEWRFDEGVGGWTAHCATELTIEDGTLAFATICPDIFIVSPLFELTPAPGDVLEITLKATTDGIAQWFWRPTTEGQYGGFSPEMCRNLRLPASDEWQTLRLLPLWQGLPKIVGIRFDPPEGKEGAYRVRSVRILRYHQGDPTPAEFDFARGAAGWIAPEGTVEERPDGIRVSLPSTDARLVSPPLRLDADACPWLTLDVTGPVGERSASASLEFRAEDGSEYHHVPFRVPGGRRGLVNLDLRGAVGWTGPIAALAVGLAEEAPAELTLHGLWAGAAPRGGGLDGPATGLEFQTAPWRAEYRLPVAPRRIDVAKEAPPETRPVDSDYTVAMWYFCAWEPEYTWDGWGQVAERSPWRLPLLYDSSDPAMEYNGLRFYRASNPRAIDWHVHWMREHAVNLLLFDWYPQMREDGTFDPSFFANRALETGFLGKAELGGPPVATNRFAGQIDFAVMWTNHGPHHRIGEGLLDYLVDQFLSQPNYYRIDGKPLVVIWSVSDLVAQSGGEEPAAENLAKLRERARARGLDGVYLAAIHGARPDLLARLGIDGVTGYHYSGSGGSRREPRRLGERVVIDHIEDYPTRTIPGHVRVWTSLAEAYGRDYLLATTPMQNWEPTFRGSGPVMVNQTPDAYREMLRRAKAFCEERGLRRFVNIEAWNEWLEGSYVEPSTQWGLGYLEAIRDIFGR